MTVGELRKKLEKMGADHPIVLLVQGDGEYWKAYASSASLVHDCLPDGVGGDDIHSAGFIVSIEAELEDRP